MTLQLVDDLPSLLVPARLDVFAERQIGRKRRGVGWQGWNPDPIMEDRMARLHGAGSFYWPNAVRAYVAARSMMRYDSTIRQIKMETISGREIARVYR